jgi:hypothetical protein
VNLGYEMLRDAVVDEVNGVKIGRMSDLVAALKKPVNGFDVFKFAPAESREQVVLDASEIDDANQDIMSRYHIPSDHVINPAPATAAAQ